jgi:hypothetical protein
MRGGTEQKRVEAGRRVAGKIHAPSCVGAFVHSSELPSVAREFQGRGLLGIIHRFRSGFGLGLGFGGFGWLFLFWHKLHLNQHETKGL